MLIDHGRSPWSESLSCGVTASAPHSISGDIRSYGESWILDSTCVYRDGCEINDRYAQSMSSNFGQGLSALTVGHRVRVVVDKHGTLRYYFDDVDMGVAALNLPVDRDLWAIIDVYGKVEEVLVTGECKAETDGDTPTPASRLPDLAFIDQSNVGEMLAELGFPKDVVARCFAQNKPLVDAIHEVAASAAMLPMARSANASAIDLRQIGNPQRELSLQNALHTQLGNFLAVLSFLGGLESAFGIGSSVTYKGHKGVIVSIDFNLDTAIVQLDQLDHVSVTLKELELCSPISLDFFSLPTTSEDFFLPFMEMISRLPKKNSQEVGQELSQLLRTQLFVAATRAARVLVDFPVYMAHVASRYPSFSVLFHELFVYAQNIPPLHFRYSVADLEEAVMRIVLDKPPPNKLRDALESLGYNEPWALEAIAQLEPKCADVDDAIKVLLAMQVHADKMCFACGLQPCIGFVYRCRTCQPRTQMKVCLSCYLSRIVHNPKHLFEVCSRPGEPWRPMTACLLWPVVYIGAEVELFASMQSNRLEREKRGSVTSHENKEEYALKGVFTTSDFAVVDNMQTVKAGIVRSVAFKDEEDDDLTSVEVNDDDDESDGKVQGKIVTIDNGRVVVLWQNGSVTSHDYGLDDGEMASSLAIRLRGPRTAPEQLPKLLLESDALRDRPGQSFKCRELQVQSSEVGQQHIRLLFETRSEMAPWNLAFIRIEGSLFGRIVSQDDAVVHIMVSSNAESASNLLTEYDGGAVENYWTPVHTDRAPFIMLHLVAGLRLTTVSVQFVDGGNPFAVTLQMSPNEHHYYNVKRVVCGDAKGASNSKFSLLSRSFASLFATNASVDTKVDNSEIQHTLTEEVSGLLSNKDGLQLAENIGMSLTIHFARHFVLACLYGCDDIDRLFDASQTVETFHGLLLLLRLAAEGHLPRESKVRLTKEILKTCNRGDPYIGILVDTITKELDAISLASEYCRHPMVFESLHPLLERRDFGEAFYPLAIALKVEFDAQSHTHDDRLIIFVDANNTVVRTISGRVSLTAEDLTFYVEGTTLRWFYWGNFDGPAGSVWGWKFIVRALYTNCPLYVLSDSSLIDMYSIPFVRKLFEVLTQMRHQPAIINLQEALSRFVLRANLSADLRSAALRLLVEVSDQYAIGSIDSTFLLSQFFADSAWAPPIQRGMKLEARNPSFPVGFCVATVIAFQDGILRLHYDGWSDNHDRDIPFTSDEIHAVGWCQSQLPPVPLNKPKNYVGDFVWKDYLHECHAEAVPLLWLQQSNIKDLNSKTKQVRRGGFRRLRTISNASLGQSFGENSEEEEDGDGSTSENDGDGDDSESEERESQTRRRSRHSGHHRNHATRRRNPRHSNSSSESVSLISQSAVVTQSGNDSSESDYSDNESHSSDSSGSNSYDEDDHDNSSRTHRHSVSEDDLMTLVATSSQSHAKVIDGTVSLLAPSGILGIPYLLKYGCSLVFDECARYIDYNARFLVSYDDCDEALLASCAKIVSRLDTDDPDHLTFDELKTIFSQLKLNLPFSLLVIMMGERATLELGYNDLLLLSYRVHSFFTKQKSLELSGRILETLLTAKELLVDLKATSSFDQLILQIPHLLSVQHSHEIPSLTNSLKPNHSRFLRALVNVALELEIDFTSCCSRSSSSEKPRLKKKSEFISVHEYVSYMRSHLKPGSRVRLLINFDVLEKGDIGTFLEITPGDPPASFNWQHYGDKHFVFLQHVEFIDDSTFFSSNNVPIPYKDIFKQLPKESNRAPTNIDMLMQAVQRGDIDYVLAAMERGEDPNCMDQFGQTLLGWAAALGFPEIVRCLLHQGKFRDDISRWEEWD